MVIMCIEAVEMHCYTCTNCCHIQYTLLFH